MSFQGYKSTHLRGPIPLALRKGPLVYHGCGITGLFLQYCLEKQKLVKSLQRYKKVGTAADIVLEIIEKEPGDTMEELAA